MAKIKITPLLYSLVVFGMIGLSACTSLSVKVEAFDVKTAKEDGVDISLPIERRAQMQSLLIKELRAKNNIFTKTVNDLPTLGAEKFSSALREKYTEYVNAAENDEERKTRTQQTLEQLDPIKTRIEEVIREELSKIFALNQKIKEILAQDIDSIYADALHSKLALRFAQFKNTMLKISQKTKDMESVKGSLDTTEIERTIASLENLTKSMLYAINQKNDAIKKLESTTIASPLDSNVSLLLGEENQKYWKDHIPPTYAGNYWGQGEIVMVQYSLVDFRVKGVTNNIEATAKALGAITTEAIRVAAAAYGIPLPSNDSSPLPLEDGSTDKVKQSVVFYQDQISLLKENTSEVERLKREMRIFIREQLDLYKANSGDSEKQEQILARVQGKIEDFGNKLDVLSAKLKKTGS